MADKADFKIIHDAPKAVSRRASRSSKFNFAGPRHLVRDSGASVVAFRLSFGLVETELPLRSCRAAMDCVGLSIGTHVRDVELKAIVCLL